MKRIELKKRESGPRCGPYVGLALFLSIAVAAVGADGPTCAPTTRAAATQEAVNKPRVVNAEQLWVGQFSQCSYNAVSSVLTYFYGPLGKVTDRKKFESETFNGPLGSMGYGGFYGWGPWTSYMVMSGKMVWNGQAVTTLRAERFSLRTAEQPEMRDKLILVHYQAGEREQLEEKLLKKLEIGPVVMWTCYAGVQDAQFGTPWHHVSRIDDHTDAVPFGPFTHSVTLYLVAGDPTKKGQEPGAEEPHVLVTDCSVRNGIFVTDLDAIVSTSSAMTTFMRASGQLNPSGIKNEEYNVVFYQSSATTKPAADEDDVKAAGEAEVLASLKAEDRAPVEAALEKSRSQRAEWVAALRKVPADEREGLVFLLANMPERDLVSLDADFVLEDVALAYKARAERPWGKEIPEEVFLNSVLPYANLNEDRDHWRPDFVNQFGPLVKDCKTASEAVVKLNTTLFKQVGVEYHATKRPRPDQSPSETIGAGYASCTGLSILLVDACRAVGVPARVVGIPAWVKAPGEEGGGNHTWVEIWDKQWHVVPAAEGATLDGGWFMQAASLAQEGLSRKDNMDHHIYAATWRDTGTPFRLVWDEMINYVHAEDVTADYAGRTVVKIKAGSAEQPAHLVLRLKGRLVAELDVKGETTLILSAGQTYEAQVGGKTVSFVAPAGKDAVVELPGEGK